MMRFRWITLITMLIACGPDADQDGFHSFRDCDDNDPRAYPKLEEVCDGIDNDCDGQVDEGVSIVAYWDRDGDGFGDPDKARRVCAMPEDGVSEAGDCDDLDPTSHPNGVEVCDEADNNCDGQIDEEVQQIYYQDLDGDGHGSGSSTTAACIPPDGYAIADDDCDDSEALAWTGAPETCDGVDNDCDGQIDEELPLIPQWIDADGDGYGDPNAPILACGVGVGISDNSLDCDDTDPNTNLDTIEIAGNGVDDDCDRYVDEYAVPDTYATVEDAVAAAPDGSVVQLDAGTFVTTVDLTGRDITFAGEGCDRTLLYGDGQGTTLTMDAGTVEQMAIAGGFAEIGGGLIVRGEVIANAICLSGNSANDTGGGLAVESGRLTLSDSELSDNTAYDGGAIFVDFGAAITVERVVSSAIFAPMMAAINARGGDVDVYSNVSITKLEMRCAATSIRSPLIAIRPLRSLKT